MARIIISGYMVRHPLAGNMLAYFHYVLGLHRLGHEVLYLEESGWPSSCYDPVGQTYVDDPHVGLRAVRDLLARYKLDIPVVYVNRDSGKIEGADWDELKRILRAADLLLNVGGVCWLPEFTLCRRRALVDMDPFFTQVGRFGWRLEEHQVFFSYGVNIGRPGCTVPTCGLEWLPTVPPVVSEIWRQRSEPSTHVFTTIANWSAYGTVTYRGERYGQKDEQFLALLDLPAHTSQKLELALSGAGPEVVELLTSRGWLVRDSGAVSTGAPRYQQYITDSRGEFSVAKHAYVKTHSGWFSDRSVCYLAAGLPVVVQDTGFSEWLPTDQGVLVFSSMDEAADGLERINADYPAHRSAAREVATKMFDYKVVLPRLLKSALSTNVLQGSPVARPES